MQRHELGLVAVAGHGVTPQCPQQRLDLRQPGEEHQHRAPDAALAARFLLFLLLLALLLRHDVRHEVGDEVVVGLLLHERGQRHRRGEPRPRLR